MDKFRLRAKKRHRDTIRNVVRINEEANSVLSMICEEYEIESICQLVSDMILFCACRIDAVEE